jgi:MoaA/NifB/PqqE/SkfB family radical SAM enzyme
MPQRMTASVACPETFERAVEALEDARRIGLETQIRTTVTRRNMHRLDRTASLAARLGTPMWSVFFPVVTGRDFAGDLAGDHLAAEDYEQVFEKLYNISRIAQFEVTTNDAMHFRRYMARRTSTAIRRCLSICATPAPGTASADSASIAGCAAARAPVPMRRPAITSLRIRDASIGRTRKPPASARRLSL